MPKNQHATHHAAKRKAPFGLKGRIQTLSSLQQTRCYSRGTGTQLTKASQDLAEGVALGLQGQQQAKDGLKAHEVERLVNLGYVLHQQHQQLLQHQRVRLRHLHQSTEQVKLHHVPSLFMFLLKVLQKYKSSSITFLVSLCSYSEFYRYTSQAPSRS